MDFFIVANSLTLGYIAFILNSTWELIVCRFVCLLCLQHIVVTLKSSKTDFSHQGQSVVIAKAPDTVCAMSAMQ